MATFHVEHTHANTHNSGGGCRDAPEMIPQKDKKRATGGMGGGGCSEGSGGRSEVR